MCLQLQKKYIQSRHINNINFFFFLLFCNFIYLHLRLSIPQRSIPFIFLLCVLCLCTHCILTEEIIILATSERDESTSVNELLSRCQQVLWSRPGNLLCVLVWFILDICKVYTCFSYEPNTVNNSNLVKNNLPGFKSIFSVMMKIICLWLVKHNFQYHELSNLNWQKLFIKRLIFQLNIWHETTNLK